MHFDKINTNDLEEIRNLQPEGWPDIISAFKFYINSAFCYPIKLVENRKTVGIGSAIIFGKMSWIAHIIVEKNFRNKGLGARIVGQLLKDLQERSIDSCLLIATDLGYPVYQKAGFRVVSEYLYLKKEKPWSNLSTSSNVSLLKDEHLPDLLELDEYISGEKRAILLKDHFHTAQVYIDHGKVTGYYFPDLGEGLICANTAEAGLALMEIKNSSVDKAILPSENKAAIDFLKRNGFAATESRRTRMVFGKDVEWKPEKIFSRIGGNFG